MLELKNISIESFNYVTRNPAGDGEQPRDFLCYVEVDYTKCRISSSRLPDNRSMTGISIMV